MFLCDLGVHQGGGTDGDRVEEEEVQEEPPQSATAKQEEAKRRWGRKAVQNPPPPISQVRLIIHHFLCSCRFQVILLCLLQKIRIEKLGYKMTDTLWYSDSGTNGQPKGVAISHTLIIQSLAKIAMKMASVRMMYDIKIQVLLYYSSPMNIMLPCMSLIDLMNHQHKFYVMFITLCNSI